MSTYEQALASWGRDHLRAALRTGRVRRVLHGVYAEGTEMGRPGLIVASSIAMLQERCPRLLPRHLQR